MRRLHGVVKHYDWGCPDTLPEILGLPPDGRPWAEYWLGTHHGGPATFAEGGYLHEELGELTFLVKFLSAAHPLSLQTHPSEQQAVAGFAAENAQGVDVDDPRRLYRDPNAKPEILIAITSFDALCGFRPVDATLEILVGLGTQARVLADHVAQGGLAEAVEALYRGRIDVDPILTACAAGRGREADLVTAMAKRYPGDPSAVVTLLLNRLRLRPGQAVYVAPGVLHAYLAGVGVEVMGCSDNVLRGGMTSKHVDVDELLGTLDFTPLIDPVVSPVEIVPGVLRYPTPGAPFEVHRVDATTADQAHRPGLWLCAAGERRGEGYILMEGEQEPLDTSSTWFWVGPAT